ncbi:hypothetical protein Nepgr_002993 [Nepenthes gracilis]|uniref:Uncharacterized protein n=1 Tax=Nepenthes gracilis TaxID=150966 RepID=A0AAD3XCR0_NEPGR|nr:hypothetical protein Nepgr_002993 [Nepenthes gracilis]
MEAPVCRYQSIALCQIQDSSRCSSPFSNSNTLFLSGPRFMISGRKWQTPFSLIKCSTLGQNLKPKPMPKLNTQMDLEEKTQVKEIQTRKPNSGLCDQIEKLVFSRRYEEALESFEILECDSGCEVGSSTYDALVNACIGLRSVRGVKKVFNHMIRSQFKLDQYMRNRVLLMHVKCGMMIDARNLFDEMPERNLVSWNTIIAGLVDSGDHMEAFHLFLAMWSEHMDAGLRTFATMIRASAGLGLIYPGIQLHSCVFKMGINDDIFVSCALIDMYSKCGSIEDAQFVFDEMPVKTTVGWNTIIAGYALHGYSEEALRLYYEMQDSGVKMDHFTFSIIVRICARLGSLEHAKQAHAGVVRHGFGLDIVANTALVDLYSKWGRIEDARNVFDRMSNKNIISWNALIAGYGNHGRGVEAVELFDKMLREEMKPNHVTFLAVLSACSYSGLSNHGWEIFHSMSREHKIKPRAMHYACMIELLGREGLLDEALALIRDAPFEPTANMWAALLTACRVHENLELGKFAAEKLYGMEPEKLNNYVVLLNIYNSLGKLEEAASVFHALKQKGLRMLPACTWIEIKKQSHVFLSGGNCHPQKKEIYQRLSKLLLELSKLGYTPEGRTLLPDVDAKEERKLLYHSEKLAIAFGLINTTEFTPLQLVQSHRICRDCHNGFKFIAKITEREIVLRDASKFHRFKSDLTGKKEWHWFVWWEEYHVILVMEPTHTLWGYLPLLVRANSKESVEYMFQALWRTRNTGLDATDRAIIRDMLQLENDSDLDPILVCLRMLIRKCVYDNINKDDIQKLFPGEVLPELQRLLTLLLQKFQREWQKEVFKDKVTVPRLKAMTWNMANSEMEAESINPVAVIKLKLQDDGSSQPGEVEVKFQVAKDSLDTMLRSMYCIRDQLSDTAGTSTRQPSQD